MTSSTCGDETGRHKDALREQATMLLTLHQHLLQHQKAAHQAFTSLDQACCTLAASLAASSAPGVVDSAALKDASSGATSPLSLSPQSTAQGFTQLLRRVEVLHQFLFINLYVHQRESVLRLVDEVERLVAGNASAPSSLPTPHSTMLDDIDTSSCGGADSSHLGEEQRELRRQITQLRYQLARPAKAHASGCHSTHTDGVASGLLPQTQTTPFSSPPHENGMSGPSSAALWAVLHAARSPRTQAGVASSKMQGAARQNMPRLRLFALSSTFQKHGVAGQQGLAAVLYAVQRRFHVHAVVLGCTASPEAEVDVAVRLGCLCLVVPHHDLGSFPVHPGLVVTSDRAVLAHMESRGDGMSSTADASSLGCDAAEGDEDLALMADGGGKCTAALEELFVSLEADFSLMTDAEPVWSSPFTTAAAERDAPGSQALVVERSALHRDGRQTSSQRKRHRSGGTVNSSALSTSASAPEGVAMSAHESDALSNTGAVLSSQSSRARITGAAWLRTSAVADVMSPAEVYDAAADADAVTPSQLAVESQHVGITQNFSSSHRSATPSDSARATPVLCPHEGVARVDDAAAPASTADVSVPQQFVFQISNSVKYLKAQLMEAIAQLGGVVDQSSGYSRACRYLVVAEGITERTEKYLGACAAAAYIVPPRFVFDSQRRGYWLANRVQEYDMSPQRIIAHAPRAVPIFSNWRVVLITCRAAAARGVLAALLAGGCTQATAFVVDITAEPPMNPGARLCVYDETCATAEGIVEGVCPSSSIAAHTLQSATHILVECSTVTAHGLFQMPDWMPACVRQPEYQPRIFTLELLYFCLCAHPERVFDAEGQLSEVDALTPACRVELV
ncbi:conserved hypothetical protein [Leishmania mexicana MHOM/GT/2001/U1103]|uniref:BRCT domain-containing protein n=1 Tax=Leishmania mexicana (strain MHOM/GT/2001/U1103) TaxID=929439 RepID=E9AWH4_LEIMU|nr:conserved hypothetical protein [Leishmania mexicana MHOM/GT/2001/U1103]CBZ27310.1 conserved hypothetical protein [Leishmania mexicana MHOM/GT/2001/U1103]